MIRNPDTSEGQPRTLFTAPPVKYDDSKFIPVPVKKGPLSFKNPQNLTFLYTWLFFKFELIVNPLVCLRSSCHLLSVWKSSFPFLPSTQYVPYLILFLCILFMFRQHGGHSRRSGSQEWTQQVEQVPADLHLPSVWSKEHHLQQAELVGIRHVC